MTTNTRPSFIDTWPLLARVGFVAFAVTSATAFTAVFYVATALALYAVLLGWAVACGLPLGSPFFGVAFPLFMLLVGVSAAVLVYTPLTACVALVAKRRFRVWLLAPLIVALVAFGAGAVLASGLDLPDEDGAASFRITIGVVLPYFAAGGYFAYWLVVFGLTQLLPWLVGRIRQG